MRCDLLWVWFSIQFSIHSQAHSRVDQKGHYFQGGERTADSFSGAEVSWVGCRTRIVADASPVGLGAVVAQEQGRTWRAVI